MERARVRVTGVVKKTEAQARPVGWAKCSKVAVPSAVARSLEAWAEKDKAPGPATAKAVKKIRREIYLFRILCLFFS